MGKALVYHGKHDIRVGEMGRPRCEGDDAVIEVKCAGICGTDLAIYVGKHLRAKPLVILGHEFSGVIVERMGNERQDLKIGDRVTVNPAFSCGVCSLCRSGSYHICHGKGLYGIDADGGFASYAKIPLRSIFQLPEKISFEEGAMVEPLAVAVRAVCVSNLRIGESAIIVGGGPIGILTALVARVAGAGDIIVIERIPFRKRIAEKFGFRVLTPDEVAFEKAYNADIIYDAAGSSAAAALGTKLVKRGGRIVIIAIYGDPVPYDLATVAYGEIKVSGTCIYTFPEFAVAISLLSNRKIDLLPLISHKFPLDAAIEAFETSKRGENAQKVLFSISP